MAFASVAEGLRVIEFQLSHVRRVFRPIRERACMIFVR
jgi:hypothetical protein